MTTTLTTQTRPSWATNTDRFGTDSGAFRKTLVFGRYCDGSPRCLDVMQYFGPRVLTEGWDASNTWRNGRAGVSITLSHEDEPTILRRAAAAILEAADLIEATR